MQANFLGIYTSTVYFNDIDADVEYRFTNEDDESDYYESDLFMRVDNSIFDGIASETNTSAIGVKIYEDYVKLWRIY